MAGARERGGCRLASLGVFLLTLDQSTPPFDDVHVRREIAHAVDRGGLVGGAPEGQRRTRDCAQPAGDVGRGASGRRGRGVLFDAPSTTSSISDGQGRVGPVGLCPRDSSSRSPVPPPIRIRSTSCRAWRKASGRSGSGCRFRSWTATSGLRLLSTRESGPADHVLLSRFRRSRKPSGVVLLERAMPSSTA